MIAHFYDRVARYYRNLVEDAAWWGTFYGAAFSLLLFISVMFLSMSYHETFVWPDLGHVPPVERGVTSFHNYVRL